MAFPPVLTTMMTPDPDESADKAEKHDDPAHKSAMAESVLNFHKAASDSLSGMLVRMIGTGGSLDMARFRTPTDASRPCMLVLAVGHEAVAELSTQLAQ